MRDVGIFVPGEVCGAGASSSKSSSSSVPLVTEPKQPKPNVREVNPDLEAERSKRAERLLKALDTVAQRPDSAPEKPYDTGMQERTCKRVHIRFAGNAPILERVNARLKKGFGWTCES